MCVCVEYFNLVDLYKIKKLKIWVFIQNVRNSICRLSQRPCLIHTYLRTAMHAQCNSTYCQRWSERKRKRKSANCAPYKIFALCALRKTHKIYAFGVSECANFAVFFLLLTVKNVKDLSRVVASCSKLQGLISSSHVILSCTIVN